MLQYKSYLKKITVTLFEAYLRSPRIQKVLSKKRADEGFSLIELVVVVAVLAILAAIAIPSFTSLNAEAKVAGAKTTLANLAKECAVKLVDSAPGATYTAATYAPNGYVLTSSQTLGTCATNDVYTLTANPAELPTFIYNAGTGAKTCTAVSGSTGGLGCNSGAW